MDVEVANSNNQPNLILQVLRDCDLGLPFGLIYLESKILIYIQFHIDWKSAGVVEEPTRKLAGFEEKRQVCVKANRIRSNFG